MNRLICTILFLLMLNLSVVLVLAQTNHPPMPSINHFVIEDGEKVYVFDPLAYVSDADRDPLFLQSFTQPAYGSLVKERSGQFTYYPNWTYSKDDLFFATICDEADIEPLCITIPFYITSNKADDRLFSGDLIFSDLSSEQRLPITDMDGNVLYHINLSDYADIEMSTTIVPFFPDEIRTNKVWPGDANLDGYVDGWDIIAVGAAYGASGVPRVTEEVSWEVTDVEDWSMFLANGINFKHIDCDGSGQIDEDDLKVIDHFYGSKVNGFPDNIGFNSTTAAETVRPEVFLDMSNRRVEPGKQYDIPIMLGLPTGGAVEMYSIICQIHYDTTIIDQKTINLTYEDSWIGSEGEDVITYSKNMPEKGIIELVITRKNGISRRGGGRFSNLSFIMEENLVGKTAGNIVMPFFVEAYRLTGDRSSTIYHSSGTIQEELSIITSNELPDNYASNIYLFPNPSKGNPTIKIPEELKSTTLEVQVYNQQGQVMSSTTLNSSEEYYTIATRQYSPGIYFIQLFSDDGNTLFTEKLIIEN